MIKPMILQLILLTVLLISLSAFASPVAAAQRCVLVEMFTWVKCGPCPHAEAVLDSISSDYCGDSLAVIRYHPLSADDPFYQQEAYDRALSYYPVNGFPTTFFDGGMKIYGTSATSDTLHTYEKYEDSLEVRWALPSPLSLDLSVTYDSTSRSGQAFVQVSAEDSIPGYPLFLRYVLIESGLLHEGTYHQEVMRDMIPDGNGKIFTIAPEGTFEDTTDYTLSASWLPENCKLVVFVQGDATHREVLQSAQRSLLPRPAVVDGLVLSKSGSEVCLTWAEVTKDTGGLPLAVDYYRVYRDTSRYYLPGSEVLLDSTTGTIYWDDAAGHVGDLEANCFYYLTAVAGARESEPSLVVGEIDKRVVSSK